MSVAASVEDGAVPFRRKSSKSKLAKQSEVIADETTDAALNKMPIPETRVESFDGVPAEPDESPSPPLKPKTLVRGNALCGDDDTKLTPRGPSRDSSGRGLTGSPGSSLSRESSNDTTHSHYTDSTGINLEDFIVTTLHKNPKDRQMLLGLEEELGKLINDGGRQVLKFPAMSSYNRMLVHRIAAFFGLDHNVDQSGGCVVVTKTLSTRTPDHPFRSYIRSDNFLEPPDGPNKRASLAATHRRHIRSCEEVRGSGLLERQKARSFEDRQHPRDQYDGLRIIAQDSSSSADIMESPMSGSGATSGGGYGAGPGATAGWSSTDSGEGGSGHHHLRPLSSNSFRPAAAASQHRFASLRATQKAGSFGGVPSGAHGSPSPVPRASPRRGQSSEAPPPRQASIPECPPPSVLGPPQHAGQILFAVPSWDQVPPGAVLINPNTYAPYVNPDGSVYLHHPPAQPHQQPQPYYQHPQPAMLCGGMQSMSMDGGVAAQSSASPSVVTYVMPSGSFPIQGYPQHPVYAPAPAGPQPLIPMHHHPQPAQYHVVEANGHWASQPPSSTHSEPSAPLSNESEEVS